MAKNKVTLTLAGDESDLLRSYKDAESAGDTYKSSIERTTDVIREADGPARQWQDRFDTLDTRAMGFRDTITGVQDSAAGWSILSGDAAQAFQDYSTKVDEASDAHDALVESGSATQEEIDASAESLAAMKDELADLESKTGSTADGLLLLGTGVGDLASGFSNLIVPLLAVNVQTIKTTATMIAGWATTAASAIASVATQVAAWVVLGVQSLISAAQVAAAWLLSVWPIALVIAAVAGLVYLIIVHWDTIKAAISAAWDWITEVTSAFWESFTTLISDQIAIVLGIVTAVWNGIKAVTSAIWNGIKVVVSAVWNGITSFVQSQLDALSVGFNAFKSTVTAIWNAIGRAITAPIKLAISAIKTVWNSTVGGRGISIPGIPGVFGGASFTIPSLAEGGVVPATRGGRIVRVSEAGEDEAVVPLSRLNSMAGGGAVTIRVDSGGTALDQVLLEVLRKAIRNQGGGVVGVLG